MTMGLYRVVVTQEWSAEGELQPLEDQSPSTEHQA